MSAHTPEPWAIDPDDRPGMEWNNHIVPANSPGRTICFMSHDGTEENVECQANARRIVACVNACKRFRIETLESAAACGGITEDPTESQIKAEQQRDELLALVNSFHRKLETYRNIYSGDKELRRLLSECEAAIAKVKP